MELKLTGIALNRSKNRMGERTSDKGVRVGIFFFYIYIYNSLAFLNWSRNRFFRIQILIISPLRNMMVAVTRSNYNTHAKIAIYSSLYHSIKRPEESLYGNTYDRV